MLVFDPEYTLKNSRFKQISKEAVEDGSDISHQYLNVGSKTIKEPGKVTDSLDLLAGLQVTLNCGVTYFRGVAL